MLYLVYGWLGSEAASVFTEVIDTAWFLTLFLMYSSTKPGRMESTELLLTKLERDEISLWLESSWSILLSGIKL